jgi:3-keto-disaccharide hydrolase
MTYFRCISLLLGFAVGSPLFTNNPSSIREKDEGFTPLFDGQSLSGWVNVNCAPGTFFVKDREIITTGKPTGYLRTVKQYENFIAEFDWMHVPSAPGAVGNSGFFVWADPIPAVGTGYTRGIEVQVLVNLTYKNKKGQISATSQGDLFSIWGATCVPDRPHPDGWARCLPSEDHCKGANEWNHYRVEANDGVLKLAVNGHFVSGLSKCKPRKGYLALESEGSECHFKNLKIKELPTTNPTKNEVADEANGHKSLYSGLDLSGWKVDDAAKKHWQPKDTVLHYDGKGEAKDGSLRTEKEYGDAEFIVDFRFPTTESKPCTFVLRQDGDSTATITIGSDEKIDAYGKLVTPDGRTENGLGTFTSLKPAGGWNRLQATLTESRLHVTVNGKEVKKLNKIVRPSKGVFALRPGSDMDFANLFVRELK